MTPPVVYPRQPDWHDKPPTAGLYMLVLPDKSIRGWNVTDVELSAAIYPTARWYGPIPQESR